MKAKSYTKLEPEEVLHTELAIRFMWMEFVMPYRIKGKDVEKAEKLFKQGDINAVIAMSIPDTRRMALEGKL